MTVYRAADEPNSCVPAPPVLSLSTGVHRKRTCRLQSGFLSWLGVCRGGREEWRGEGFGLMQPYEEPALPPCFHDNGSPTVFSRGTASASESSSQWCFGPSRYFPSAALSSSSFSTVSVFLKSCSTSSSLAAVLLNLDVEHHLHLNQGWILPFVPCLNSPTLQAWAWSQRTLKIFRPAVL